MLAVVKAFPAAMNARDPKTGLLPVETVAIANGSEEPGPATQTESVDFFYRLLRRETEDVSVVRLESSLDSSMQMQIIHITAL
jgi:hypothetical protein